MKTVDRILKIKVEKLPPDVDFIENAIKQAGIDPIRWAIIDVFGTQLTLAVAGFEVCN